MRNKIYLFSLLILFSFLFCSKITYASDLENIEVETIEIIEEVPTPEPTLVPTEVPTPEPTPVPTEVPTPEPTLVPTEVPTPEPTLVPTEVPIPEPTPVPTEETFIMLNLVGLFLEEVFELIKIEKENIIINYEVSDSFEENTILEQSILENEEYTINSELIVTVSSLPLELEETGLFPELTANFSLNRDLNAFSAQPSDVGNSNILLNWDDIPSSYEYNWDNSENCWNRGVWIDGVCYKTPYGSYSTDVRHKIQIYCDDKYVYVHIVYSKDYDAKNNGNDFRFYLNGNSAEFQVQDKWRGELPYQMFSRGTHSLVMSHRNTGLSYTEVIGGEAYLYVSNDDNRNNQLEIKIPLEEFVRQNPNIDLNTLSKVEFFTPNLMYRTVSCAGSSTFGLLLLIPLLGIIVYNLYKKEKQQKNNI